MLGGAQRQMHAGGAVATATARRNTGTATQYFTALKVGVRQRLVRPRAISANRLAAKVGVPQITLSRMLTSALSVPPATPERKPWTGREELCMVLAFGWAERDRPERVAAPGGATRCAPQRMARGGGGRAGAAESAARESGTASGYSAAGRDDRARHCPTSVAQMDGGATAS